MRNPRLFTDQPLTPGDQVVLKGNVAQHLGRVLRSRSGDHIALFNGDGQEFAAASAKGFQLLQLLPRVLRTETAPAAALSVLGVFWGEMPS